jgi:hypothetical protein
MIKLRPWHKTALVGLAYAILVGIMTWPAISNLGQRLIGDNEDAWIFFWNNWWFREALTSDLDLFSTPYLFFPQGTSLVAHSSSYLTSFLGFILEPLSGPVVAYNLVFIIGLWVGAMGMYLLVKDITDHPLASFFAGFVFAFAPYHVSQALAHAHLGSIQWWPFFVLFLRRTLYGGRRRDAVAAGVFAALTLWTGLQLAVLLALWALLYILWFLWRQRFDIVGDKDSRNRFLSSTGLVLLVTLLLSAPLFYVFLSNWSVVTGSATIVDESMSKQTDLLAYLIPPDYNSIWGDLVDPLYDKFPYHRGFRPFIGFTVLGLAVAAAWGWRKKAGFWLLTAGLWILMAAGPVIRVNGSLLNQVSLPYKWLGTIFPISTIRAPDRFNLLLVLTMAVLVGMGVAYLARQRYWRWALIPLGFLLFLEFLFVPIPTLKIPDSSPFLEEMELDGETYAVVDYPMDYTLSKYWLYYQTLHGKPTVDGHVSRYTSETYDFLAGQPLLNALYEGGEVARFLPGGFFEERRVSPVEALGPALRDLEESGVEYFMLHRSFMTEDRLDHFKSVLPLAPIYQDESLIVYNMDQSRFYQFDPFPLAISPDFDLVEANIRLSPDRRELDIDLITRLKTTPLEEIACSVAISDTTAARSFVPYPSDVDWQEGDLSRSNIHLPIPDDLPEDQYQWGLDCPDGTSYTGLERLFYSTGEPSLFIEKTDLDYADLFKLDGYRWWFEGGDLHLALQWQSLGDIEQDYKVFVHLLDESGEIVRQNDFVPCDWSCPTSQWNSGQRVADESTLSLAGLTAGNYKLALGLYDAISGDRLEARDSSGRVLPEATFILRDTIMVNKGW